MLAAAEHAVTSSLASSSTLLFVAQMFVEEDWTSTTTDNPAAPRECRLGVGHVKKGLSLLNGTARISDAQHSRLFFPHHRNDSCLLLGALVLGFWGRPGVYARSVWATLHPFRCVSLGAVRLCFWVGPCRSATATRSAFSAQSPSAAEGSVLYGRLVAQVFVPRRRLFVPSTRPKKCSRRASPKSTAGQLLPPSTVPRGCLEHCAAAQEKARTGGMRKLGKHRESAADLQASHQVVEE